MPTFQLLLPPQARSRWHPGRNADYHPFPPLAAAARLIAQWIERARQRQALAGLEDRMLRDIGITRVDAVCECEKPFWR
jgi:uncharacterized protein YjiS (DUF1127 family)